MHLRLDFTVRPFERFDVQRESWLQAEELEVIPARR